MVMADPKEYLDRRYENTETTELPDAPIDALRGLGKAGSEALRKAIGVKSIRDLATNQFVLAAQEILQAAEPGAFGARETVAASQTAGTVAEADLGLPQRSTDDDLVRSEEEDELVRSEEELEIGTEQARRGRAGVRKRVVSEQLDQTVPVEREQLRVEREPIPEGERRPQDASIAADEHTVELFEERPVVEKQVVPKERIRVGKEVVTDEEHVSEEIRREEVEVDDPDRRR
jgi:uncharacterized protein (TIGR02271 family)